MMPIARTGYLGDCSHLSGCLSFPIRAQSWPSRRLCSHHANSRQPQQQQHEIIFKMPPVWLSAWSLLFKAPLYSVCEYLSSRSSGFCLSKGFQLLALMREGLRGTLGIVVRRVLQHIQAWHHLCFTTRSSKNIIHVCMVKGKDLDVCRHQLRPNSKWAPVKITIRPVSMTQWC